MRDVIQINIAVLDFVILRYYHKYYNNDSKMYNPKQVLIGRLLEMAALLMSARLVQGGPDKQQ